MPDRINPPLPTRSRVLARGLRQRGTDAEARLWFHLRDSRLADTKFRRQHPIPPYVIDFYCATLKLAIEVDGSQHSEEADQERSRFLRKQGIELLRFWDNDVLNNTSAVLQQILMVLQRRTLTPTPLPTGEGLMQSEL